MFFKILFSKHTAQHARGLLAAPRRPKPKQIKQAGPPTDSMKPRKPAKSVRDDRQKQAADSRDSRHVTGALQLLALFQRQGRLVDFLMEDISRYSDSHVGVAVRAIHRDCRRVLIDCFAPAPVLPSSEGEELTIDEGFDPSHIRITGSLENRPPFHGVLRHKGWKAAGHNFPAFSAAIDPAVIAPAEVEVKETDQ